MSRISRHASFTNPLFQLHLSTPHVEGFLQSLFKLFKREKGADMAEPREIITGRFEWTTEVHAHITRWAEQFLDEYHGRTDAAQTHPLDKSQPEKIRILELLPGRGDERIVCHIRTQPLVSAARFGSTEEYEAVSYVWGDPSRTQSITIETNSPPDSTAGGAVGGTSRELAITHSVYRLLCHLRKSHKPRSLWIDQICIDQENAEEKARQIRRSMKLTVL
jgi:hypothetical protein